jgi:hypothetical protein
VRCEPGPGHGFDTWPRCDPIRIPRVVHVSRWRYERHATSTYASWPSATVLGRESGRGLGHGLRLHGSSGVAGGLLDTRAVVGQHLGVETFLGPFL